MSSTAQITITTVFDNYSVDARLETRWGFAAVVSTADGTVLFDTGGDANTLVSNMRVLALDPKVIDNVVISHIHGDHIGGLQGLLRIHPDVLVSIPNSFPNEVRRMIKAEGARYSDISAPSGIAPGVYTTGPMGTSLREQALVVESAEGLIVITGCAHPGIVEMVKRARAIKPNVDVALVMGGFHLVSSTQGEIDAVIHALQALEVRRVAPSHCTGDLARSRFREKFGRSYVEGGAGMVFRVPAPQAQER